MYFFLEKLYDELSTLKRVELNEFYIESLLLEIDLDETRLLHELFGYVGGDELKRLCTELSKQSDSFLEAMIEENSEASASGDEVAVSPAKASKKATKAKLAGANKKGEMLDARANINKSLKASTAVKAEKGSNSKIASKPISIRKESTDLKSAQNRTIAADSQKSSKKTNSKSSNKISSSKSSLLKRNIFLSYC